MLMGEFATANHDLPLRVVLTKSNLLGQIMSSWSNIVKSLNRPKSLLLSVPLLSVSLVAVCQAQVASGTPGRTGTRKCSPALLNRMDKSFIIKVNGANLGEMAFTPVVLKTSSDSAVTTFANQMVADHTKANNELTELAQQKNVSLPGVVPAKAQEAIDKLSAKPEPFFDHLYRRDMIKDHTGAVALFNKEIADGSDSDVIAFARKYLPTIQMHLQMAQALPR